MAADLRTNVIISARDEASRALKAVRNNVKALNKSIKANEKAIKEFAIVMGVVGAAGITMGSKMVKAASDLEELNSKATVLFGDTFPEVQKSVEGIAKEVGRASSDVLGFAADMAAVLEPAGLARDAFQGMSVDLAKLAIDMASFHNRSDAEAFNALRAGIVGETEPLKRLGIVMTQVNLKNFAMTKGIKMNILQMNQAQLATLRYNFIMESTSSVQGDAARTAASVANQIKRFEGNVKTLFEVLGQPVLGVVSGALQGINAAMTSAIEAFEEMNPVVLQVITGLFAFVSIGAASAAVIALLALALPKVTGALAVLGGSLSVVGSAFAFMIGPIGIVLASLTALAIVLIKDLGGARQIVGGMLEFINENLALLGSVALATAIVLKRDLVMQGFRLLVISGKASILVIKKVAIAMTAQLVPSMLKAAAAVKMVTLATLLLMGKFILIGAAVAVVAFLIFQAWRLLSDKLEPIFEFMAKIGRAVPAAIAKAWNVASRFVVNVIDNIIGAIILMGTAASKIPGIDIDISGLERARVAINEFADAAVLSEDDVTGAFDNIKESVKGFVGDLSDFANLGGGSAGLASGIKEQVVSSKDAIADLRENYKDMREGVEQEIKKLEQSHIEKMQGIKESMERVKDALIELEAQYQKSMANIGQSVGRAFVDHTEKMERLRKSIKDLQDQANKEDKGGSISAKTNDRIREQQEELKKLEDAQAKIIAGGFGEKYAESIDEAFRRQDLTSLERAIEDATVAEEELLLKTEARRMELEAENEKLKEQAQIAMETYAIMRTELELTRLQMQAFHDSYIANLENIDNTTTKIVNSLKKKLEELRQVISAIDALLQAQASITGGTSLTQQVKQGRTGFVAPISIPGFAHGGTGDFGDGTLAALHGNEAIVPLTGGREIPVKLQDSTGPKIVNITVDMAGVVIKEDVDADRFIDEMTRQIELQQLAIS